MNDYTKYNEPIRTIMSYFPNNDMFRRTVAGAIDYIRSNFRRDNPYHNAYHCIMVSRNALEYMDSGLSILDRTVVALSGLFHDFNHSGRPLSVSTDSRNLDKAVNGLHRFKMDCVDSSIMHIPWESVESIIRSTEAVLEEGRVYFPNKPSTLGRYVRDADVSMLYWIDGRDTLKGLAREMGRRYDSNFMADSIRFFSSVELYTEKANALRSGSKCAVDKWLDEGTHSQHTETESADGLSA